MTAPHMRHRFRRVVSTSPEREPTARLYAKTFALLGLLALLGKAVSNDCQAVQTVLEVWRHFQHVGF